MSEYIETLEEYWNKEENQYLRKEWDYIKNKEKKLRPDELKKYSTREAWWICEKGHSFKSIINRRVVIKNKCPECYPGERLLEKHRELVEEWDFEKNGDINIETMTENSDQIVWWKCSAGHTFRKSVERRVYIEKECPYCIIKYVKDEPELAIEYDHEKNTINFDELRLQSCKKVWWKCKKSGHEWLAPPSYRARNKNRVQSGSYTCPFCSGQRAIVGENDLFTVYPELKDEWDYEKNKEIKLYPEDCKENTNRIAWWTCARKHSYKRAVFVKTKRNKECPVCKMENKNKRDKHLAKGTTQKTVDSKRISELRKEGKKKLVNPANPKNILLPEEVPLLKVAYPEIAEMWNEEKNKESVENVHVEHVMNYHWWKCVNGHEFISTLNTMIGKTRTKFRCPYCAGLKTKYSVGK